MKLLRNPEVRFTLLAEILAGVAWLGVLTLLIKKSGPLWGILLASVAAMVLFIAIYLIIASLHAKKVRAFTLKAERSLHGGREMQFDEFKEGDFAVLQNVIQGMALAHYRQEEQLETEKGLLKQSLSDISHQIKTPLASITLTGEQLLADEVSPAYRKRGVRKILEMTKHVDDLVKTLLKISRMDADVVAYRSDEFSAGELLEGVCEPLEISMELREIALERTGDLDAALHSDRLWLTQALLNIVKNCMEKTPPGGKISIDVADNAVATQFVIRDTGPGISPEDLPHIFKRFYSGKNADENSVGIGLAFSQMVIHNLGGTVKAANHPDGGAMFTVRLIKMNV